MSWLAPVIVIWVEKQKTPVASQIENFHLLVWSLGCTCALSATTMENVPELVQ
jgi:hypothetical protein